MNDTSNHLIPSGQRRIDQPDFAPKLDALISECGGDPSSFDGRLIRDMLATTLKLITDRRDTGELKLLVSSYKELRHAYRVFAQYPDTHKISIFGSARTPADHPDYAAAVAFSREMARRGWLSITGAGDGIMKAGHEGPGRDASFGLAIRLPFETTANTVIQGDEKLIHFRYFFTRKLIFVSQCEAVAVFPGGYGTQDELFEALTLTQTGKGAMIPIVLVEGAGGGYWRGWDRCIREHLEAGRFISPEDTGFYHIASNPFEAADFVCRFYRNFHSARYVEDDLVIRLKGRITDHDLALLNSEFTALIKHGAIVQREHYETEREHTHLPRLAFTHTRRHFGLVRRLLDRLNSFDLAPLTAARGGEAV